MIVGALLAGGQSRRMGQDKAAIVFEGKTLCERALATLREVSDRVVIVGHGRGCPADVPRILDDGGGPASALRALIKESEGDVFVVLPVDMPFVGAEHLRALLAHATPRAACFAGSPLPLVITRGPLGEGAKLMKAIEPLAPVMVSPGDARVLENVNTQEDLERLRAS